MVNNEEILCRVNIILQELASIVSLCSKSENVSPECPMWWDPSHDVQSPVSKLNCSFDQDSCSSLSFPETILSDCFLPPTTQSPHHDELLRQPAELHDVSDLPDPELSSIATALPDVYSLVPPDLQLYEDEEKTATVSAIGSEVTAALSYASSTDAQSVSPLTSTDDVSSSEDSSSSDHTGQPIDIAIQYSL